MAQPVSDIKAKQKKQAAELLKNPVFVQISEELDTQYYQRWSDTLDQVKRDELYNLANGVREVLRMIKYLAEQKLEYKH